MKTQNMAFIAIVGALLGISFYAGHYTREEKPTKPYLVFTKPPPVTAYMLVPVPTKDATFVTCLADCDLSGILTTALVVNAKGSASFDHVAITYDGSPWYAAYGIVLPTLNESIHLGPMDIDGPNVKPSSGRRK